jgi:hypothetical protein
MIIALLVIGAGVAVVLWAQVQAERSGRGGGWGGLARTLILAGGAFAAAAVVWAYTR